VGNLGGKRGFNTGFCRLPEFRLNWINSKIKQIETL